MAIFFYGDFECGAGATWTSVVAEMVKNMPAIRETLVQSLGQKDPLEEPTSVFLPGEYHEQRNLAGCGPWDHKDLDMTE